ncbi:MAG: Spy/CpxP family protein refolding chaperone [Gammaproteobacteria bacterium]
MNRKTVTGLMLGVLITFLGAGSSVVLAHGGGQTMGSGHGAYGMGHMGMMGMMAGSEMMGSPRMMGGMGHRGMMHMMHRRSGMMGMGPLGMLDLSDEQRAKVRKIQDDLRKRHWNTMGKIMDEQSELRELFVSEKRDPKAIGAVYGKIFDYKQQMIEEKIEARNRMHAVLTEEQRKQLKQMRRGMRGPGHRDSMSRGGMMGSSGTIGG